MPDTPRLIHILSSSFWGGREEYALDICRGFSEMGWRVSVFTRDMAAIDTPFRAHGVRVRHLPLRGYADLATEVSLSHHLRHTDALTVVHAHKYRDAFLALLARKLSRRRDVRVVLTCHRVRPGRDTWLARRICRNLHALVFVSRLARDTFMSAWPDGLSPVPADRVHTLHSSIYMPGQGYAPLPQTGPKIAMFYGRVVPGKGVETFVSALEALRGMRARARIVGPGDPDYIDMMKRLADRLGVMDMIDWRNGPVDIHPLMDTCHFGVVPSHVREAFSLPTAMFMAHGRGVVCTDNGAQREYMAEGAEALFVPPGDVDAMKQALRHMAGDGDVLQRMGTASRLRYENCLGWPRFAAALAEIYRNGTL